MWNEIQKENGASLLAKVTSPYSSSFILEESLRNRTTRQPREMKGLANRLLLLSTLCYICTNICNSYFSSISPRIPWFCSASFHSPCVFSRRLYVYPDAFQLRTHLQDISTGGGKNEFIHSEVQTENIKQTARRNDLITFSVAWRYALDIFLSVPLLFHPTDTGCFSSLFRGSQTAG